MSDATSSIEPHGHGDNLPPDHGQVVFWTPERVSQLKWCLSQGMSYADIGAHFGVTRCAVGGAIKRNNLGNAQPTYWSPERLDELRRLLRENKTNVQIGMHFDLPTSNVTTAINRYALGKFRPRKPGQNARHEGKQWGRPQGSRRKNPFIPFPARPSPAFSEPTIDEMLAELPTEVRDLPSDQSPDAVSWADYHPGRHCHWPMGDPRSDEFRFCGTKLHTGPYCLRHHARAYRKPSARANR
jgi:GcrA cell cycle regulator